MSKVLFFLSFIMLLVAPTALASGPLDGQWTVEITATRILPSGDRVIAKSSDFLIITDQYFGSPSYVTMSGFEMLGATQYPVYFNQSTGYRCDSELMLQSEFNTGGFLRLRFKEKSGVALSFKASGSMRWGTDIVDFRIRGKRIGNGGGGVG